MDNVVYAFIRNSSILDILWLVIGVWSFFLSLCNDISTIFAKGKCVFQNRNKGCDLSENILRNFGFEVFEGYNKIMQVGGWVSLQIYLWLLFIISQCLG